MAAKTDVRLVRVDARMDVQTVIPWVSKLLKKPPTHSGGLKPGMEKSEIKNKVLKVKDELILRKDIDRCVIYPVSIPLKEKPFEYMILHPKQAILLSLFDGKTTLGDVIKKFCYLLNVDDKNIIEKGVINFIQRNIILFEEVKSTEKLVKSYSPFEFVIPEEKIDLDPTFVKIPINALLIPTLKCSQNCVYCYAYRDVKNINTLPIEKWLEIIEECKRLKFSGISISGGEPFSYPYIFELLKKIKECGFSIQIPTKKLLSYEELKKLKEIGYNFFQLSIDTLEPELLDRVVGVKGYHEKLPMFLKNVKELNFKLAIVCVVTSWNIKSIPHLIESLCKEEFVISIVCTQYGRSQFRHRDEFYPSEKEIEWLSEKIFFLREKYPNVRIVLSGDKEVSQLNNDEKMIRWKNRPKCSAAFFSFVVLPDGKVTICEELYYHPEFIIGDIIKEDILKMWHSPKAALLRRYKRENIKEDSPCKLCKEYEYCYWIKGKCWKRALIYYGRIDYPDPLCPFAP